MAATEIHPSDEGRLINPSLSITGTPLATVYELRRYVSCGVTGTYRLFGPDGTTYADIPLVAGGFYPFMTTKITTTGGAATVDGEVIAHR